MSELISVARDGEELGGWSAADVAKMVDTGILQATDFYWRTGMRGWEPLSNLVLPRPVTQTFAVTFGSAFAVDKLGFTGRGVVNVAGDGLTIQGPRLWPPIARVGVFVVLTPLLWILLSSSTHLIHGDSALMNAVGAAASLFTVLGSPLLSLLLIGKFCASPALLQLSRSAVGQVKRTGAVVSFNALTFDGKTGRAIWRAATKTEAGQLASALV